MATIKDKLEEWRRAYNITGKISIPKKGSHIVCGKSLKRLVRGPITKRFTKSNGVKSE